MPLERLIKFPAFPRSDRSLFATEDCETVIIIMAQICLLILFNPTLIAERSIKCQLSMYLADNLHFIGYTFIQSVMSRACNVVQKC